MLRFFLVLLLLTTTQAFAGEIIRPEFFTATYNVQYKGFNAGTITFELRPADDGTVIYESSVKPGFLASFVVSRDAIERTVLQIDAHGVRPLCWYSEDGTADTEDDGQLTFDWAAREVTGTVEDKTVALATETGLQDRLSMQVAMLTALLRGETPGKVMMIDEDRIKHYSYERKSEQQVEVAGGEYATIVYESTRPGSSRFKRIYHAPALGYLPVRFENYKDSNLQAVMELVAVTPGGGAGPRSDSGPGRSGTP
ncbi:MAG: DUF3108 domain-containing protein [Desulfuromonadales bacterium]|nr:DUF3108 domain-containing protein [Desulfuromonadales bacterium]